MTILELREFINIRRASTLSFGIEDICEERISRHTF